MSALTSSLLFLGVPLLMYVMQGVFVYAAQGRWGMCIAMCAYALANVGLILDAILYKP
jgi:hypothetical protein